MNANLQKYLINLLSVDVVPSFINNTGPHILFVKTTYLNSFQDMCLK